jgi:hypothetical protein
VTEEERMEQTVSVSVDALTQAFSAAFRQEFQPLKQELQTLAANSTSQHLDNGTGTSRIACEGDSMANIKRKYTINGEGVWIQGKSEQEILEKACALMGAQTRPAPRRSTIFGRMRWTGSRIFRFQTWSK